MEHKGGYTYSFTYPEEMKSKMDKAMDDRGGINYKDLIDLGFKRKESHDQNFINVFGYDWFWLEKTLLKKGRVTLLMEWCPSKRIVDFLVVDIEDVIETKTISNIEEVIEIVEFYKLIKKHK